MDVDPAEKVEDPAGHVVHALDAATLEYSPMEQLVHTLAVVAPAMFEYVSAGQLVQLALPELFLNFPAAQAVQTSPSLPVYPMLHLHVKIDLDVLENGDCEFAGHDWHLDSIAVMYNSGIIQYGLP